MSKMIKLILMLVSVGLFMRYGWPVAEFLFIEAKVNNGMIIVFIFWVFSILYCHKKVDDLTEYTKELEVELLETRSNTTCNRRGLADVSRRLMELDK